MLQQRRSGGGAQLAPDLPAVDGHAPEQQRRGRGGDGQDPVSAPHLPAARGDGGADNLVRGGVVHQEARRRHVRKAGFAVD